MIKNLVVDRVRPLLSLLSLELVNSNSHQEMISFSYNSQLGHDRVGGLRCVKVGSAKLMTYPPSLLLIDD